MKTNAMLSVQALAALGLKEKDFTVFQILAGLGSAPLRKIAEASKLGRGTTYDALKRLIEHGLVSYVDATTHRYFTAEDPKKLLSLSSKKELEVKEAEHEIKAILPSLQNMLGKSEYRPAIRYYEGAKGVRDILEDVISTTSTTDEKTYRVYSSQAIRKLIANSWPEFNRARLKKKIQVKAIATGPGGTTVGLDERRWLITKTDAPTYIFIYKNKTAYVAIDAQNQLFGVTIEDEAVATTQRIIFEKLWQSLPNNDPA